MSLLSLENVSVLRNGSPVLGPLDLKLETRGITCILGPNGAGKSVFLGLCHGMFAPDFGVVKWDGIAAVDSRQDRSFMFQTAAVLRRSVRANVAFSLQAHGVARAERSARVEQALDFARLVDKASQPAASLSGGEKQRMALARAWVTRPKVILLDEPSANLDPASSRALEDMLQDIAKDTGVMIATHNLPQARRLAAHVLVFVGGKVLVNSAADKFYNQAQAPSVADFLEGRL